MNRAITSTCLLSIVLAVGCQSSPEVPAEVLGLDDTGQTIVLRPGREIIIILRDPAPGGLWTESAENASSSGVVQRIIDTFEPKTGGFRYRAIAPGEVTIKLEYKYPLESTAATQPLQTVSYHVRVE